MFKCVERHPGADAVLDRYTESRLSIEAIIHELTTLPPADEPRSCAGLYRAAFGRPFLFGVAAIDEIAARFLACNTSPQ